MPVRVIVFGCVAEAAENARRKVIIILGEKLPTPPTRDIFGNGHKVADDYFSFPCHFQAYLASWMRIILSRNGYKYLAIISCFLFN